MKTKDFKNALLLYTTIYTVATLLNSILWLKDGVYEDPVGNWHEIDRAIIVLIGVLAYELLLKLTIKPKILQYIIAYVPTMLLVFLYVWLSSFREKLAKSAYMDIWTNYTFMFIVVCVISFVYDMLRKKRK